MSKVENRKRRIEEDLRREIVLKAYRDSQLRGVDNPIRVGSIPYTKFQG